MQEITTELDRGYAEGLEDLPRRIFLEADREPNLDPDGFVLPIGKKLTMRDLLEQAAVLVVAHPWTGKTFVAEALHRIRQDHPYSELTCFEERERGTSIEPSWWDRWKASQDSAFWIVDAVDEDARKDRQSLQILRLVRGLSEGVRARLHLIFFCRINEIPEWFEKGLAEIFGPWSLERPQGLRHLRLAGFDRETARIHLGHRFDQVCELIRNNDLQPLASYPIVLEHIAKRAEQESLSKEEVWVGVLTDLLREKRDDPLHPAFQSEIEDRFAVAQKLAALTTFCEIGEIGRDDGLEAVLPTTLLGYHELRLAARETWRTTVFERSERGFRFCQDHVRQWLTAFALRDMSLLQVHPLLSLESGELDPSHEGVMGLLANITRHSEVKDWIVAKHGGLPDTGLSSLDEAVHALDKLQELARSSPWGVSVWREERLKAFGKVAGMGAEIAQRLAWPLQPTEQKLLIEIAFSARMSEAVQPAIRLLQDTTQDERVRTQAATLVAQLGTPAQLESLLIWVESQDRNDAPLPTLAAALYDQGLWSFETASDFALSLSESNSWLQYQLADDLSLDRARWLISERVRQSPELISQHLMEKALKRIVEQEVPCDNDIAILIPLVLHGEISKQGRTSAGANFAQRFLQKRPSARRKLFIEGMLSDPERQGKNSWRWANILDGEDAGWLLELVREKEFQPAWLSQILYFTAYRQGVSQSIRRRIREAIRGQNEELLDDLDRRRRRQKESERRSQKRWRQDEGEPYELDSLVRDTLSSKELELRHKMLRLSWCCFEPPSQRPSNVSGQWEDLPTALRSEVLAVCREALSQCPPTPIPDGSSYSSWTSHEAVCFDRLIEEDETFALTSEMIRKWLPSLLRDWVTGSGYEPTLRRCFEVDRTESEDVFLDAILRSMRRETGSIYLLQELPRDLWSERLAARLEREIVFNEGIAPEARIHLLWRIGRIYPSRASAIALTWTDEAAHRGEGKTLRDASIDVLLMVSPQQGWEHLKRLIQQEEPGSVLRRMSSLHPHHYGPDAAFNSWPAARLGEFEELLFQEFPPAADPQWVAGEARSLGVDDDLRSLRDRLPSLLYKRDEEGDHVVLERLADRYPRIREWLDDVRAQQGAEGVLAGLGRGTRPPGTGRKVPLALMLKLLLDLKYRLLGTVDDLQEVILEQIRLISTEAKQHLAMLYHPRPREKGQKRKHLQEDALQAYIHCRLTDRLSTVLGAQGVRVVPFVDREVLAALDHRNDLKIQASSYEGKPLIVIVEIKWSDHDKVSTSQVDQLGHDYLRQNGLTHGIYLVGWCGLYKPWKKETLGEPPKPRSSLHAWQAALKAQADLLSTRYRELRIEPLVIDLMWGQGEPAGT